MDSLSAQRDALREREIALAVAGADRERAQQAEHDAWNRLILISPERLLPILIRNGGAEWRAAHLVERLAASNRVLLTAPNWKLLLTRQSAQIIPVPSEFSQDFAEISRAQQLLYGKIKRLLDGIATKGDARAIVPASEGTQKSESRENATTDVSNVGGLD